MTASAPTDRRWVFGPIPDLLAGCGVGYAILISLLPLLPIEQKTLATVGVLGTLVIGVPHYGATLLRVYRRAEDRRKYAFFSVYLSALVWLWFAVGLYDLRVGSAMITLYLTWSPWHYTGQNYGLSVMFLRRRGIIVSDRTKKLLYASFSLSFALAFLSLHRGMGGVSYGVGDFIGTRFYFIHLGIPVWVWSNAFALTGFAYIAITVLAFASLLRSARAVDLIPVAALVMAQALWFSVPYTWTWMTNTTLEGQGVGWLFVWAILGHSVQYLWITTYYAVGRTRGRVRWGYLFAALGAGSAIWTLPALVFSPQVLGTHPYNLGLFLMIAAAVNLQHFILDGAIWKLRDSGVGRILLAETGEASDLGRAPPEDRPWVRNAGWAAGAAFTVLSLYGAIVHLQFSHAYYASEFTRARAVADRLVAILRDDPRFYLTDAFRASKDGDSLASLAAFQSSVDFYPTPEGYRGLGLAHYGRSEFAQAESAFRTGLALNDREGRTHHQLGKLLVATGRLREGVARLERAQQLLPTDVVIGVDLAAARILLQRENRP